MIHVKLLSTLESSLPKPCRHWYAAEIESLFCDAGKSPVKTKDQ
jgi:hypothetical protein